MSKRQSSITSFFVRTPKQERNKEEDKDNNEVAVLGEKKAMKRSNSQTIPVEESPLKTPLKTPKRARVVIESSSSEDNDDSDDENFEVEKEDLEESSTDGEEEGDHSGSDEEMEVEEEDRTPEKTPAETPKTKSRITSVSTPKMSSNVAKGGKIEKESGNKISLDEVEDKMKMIMNNPDVGRNKKSLKEQMKNVELPPSQRFDHEGFDFIKPENIRDGQKRRPTDPDYDPKTLWVPPDFLNKQTPGHKQWWLIKSQYFDTIILFKVGKFYETYHMDAVEVVRALNIAFMRGSYAHAGFPEHASSKFADQLMNHGYKVARVEQTETPQQLEERNRKLSQKNKVVRREVCRVTSNGTRTYGILDGVDLGNTSSTLDPTAKYLLSIKENHNSETGKSSYGVCMVDTTTAKFKIGKFNDDDYRSNLRTLLANVVVVQVLVEKNSVSASTKAILGGILCTIPVEYLVSKRQFLTANDAIKILCGDEHFGSDSANWPDALKGMLDESSVLPRASDEYSLAISAFGAVIWYLRDSLIDVDMLSMRDISIYDGDSLKMVKASDESKPDWKDRSLVLDGTAVENLNIVPNSRESHSTSLYHVINKCLTPFGRRLLRGWLLQPTCDPEKLKKRQEAIKWMTSSDATSFLTTLTSFMRKIPDLDRLLQKIHTIGLKYRAEKHPDSRAVMFDTLKTNQKKIAELLAAIDGFHLCSKLYKEYIKLQKEGEGCELLDELIGNEKHAEIIDENISEFEKMFNRKSALETGKIVPNAGCDEQYDEAVKRVSEAEQEIQNYAKSIGKKYQCTVKLIDSGKLKNLMEMPENAKVSSAFDVKSRRKGFIRYSTEDLVELQGILEEAQKEKAKLGDDATRKVFEQFGCKNEIWRDTVNSVAHFDVLLSLALFAKSSPFDMCMPEFDFDTNSPFVAIDKGIHPCLALQSRNEVTGTTSFIANSTTMGESEATVMLLTGPNMGGKSTLMRQTAVLCILAHIGSMVPASSMRLSPIDRIFTRIGANDRIMCGESTFFIELKETDVMLKNATKHSLLLIDELGRGTSTFDGTAIASAVLQSIADDIACRTFFSTHYHSICNSFIEHPNVRLAHMKCVVDKENNEDPTMEDVTFLYELESGTCPKSYGFYAAKLAGIDQTVVRNAFAESNRFAKNLVVDPRIRQLVESARDGNVSVDELRRMVEAM